MNIVISPKIARSLTILVAVLLAVQIARFGISGWAADHGYLSIARAVRSNSQAANGNAAAAALVSGNLPEAVRLSRIVLARSPSDAQGLRVFGLAADRLNDASAPIVMTLAAGLGWRDVQTQRWLINDGLRRGDVAAAVISGDALARTDSGRAAIFSLFWALAKTADGAAALGVRLLDRPNWRGMFFRSAAGLTATDGDSVLNLIPILRKGGQPASAQELGPFVNAQLKIGQYARAYNAWRAGRPSDDRGALVSFPYTVATSASSPTTAFDWRFPDGRDAGFVTVQQDSSGSGLLVSSSHRAHVLATRLVALAPGRYIFSAKMVLHQGSISPFAWGVSCEPNGSMLAQEPAIAGTLAFTVPATDCAAQTIALVDTGHSSFPDRSIALLSDARLRVK